MAELSVQALWSGELTSKDAAALLAQPKAATSFSRELADWVDHELSRWLQSPLPSQLQHAAETRTCSADAERSKQRGANDGPAATTTAIILTPKATSRAADALAAAGASL